MNSEAASNADFSAIRYAQCWEDADVLLAGLDIQPGEVCLSIASAGDNTLAMLTRRPARVIAIDLSRAQLACLELRIVAPGLFWLFLYAHYAATLLLFPFTTLFSAHLAMIAVSWLSPTDWSGRNMLRRLRAALTGATIALLPLLALTIEQSVGLSTSRPLRQQLPAFLVANLVAVALASALFAWILPHLIAPDGRYMHVHDVGSLCALAASILTLVLLLYAS